MISENRLTIRVSLAPEDAPLLQALPWYKPLSDWKKGDAKFLEVKSGVSRHVVRFVQVKRKAFAVKETSAEIAEREYHSYARLLGKGIPTLIPVGTVIRDEGVIVTATKSGPQMEAQTTGYLVTKLLEYALPDSYLFKRAFSKENRRRIWDAIVRLFVQLHHAGVYWGDASLANMMILFAKERVPEMGTRTLLKAVLADAETVEFHPSLSDHMRRADVDCFLESMLWTEADMLRDPLMTKDDQEYILHRYLDVYEIEREERAFELLTHIDVDQLLGSFDAKDQAKVLLKHIYEHKWYMSEREGKETSIEQAAIDWYSTVFKPVLKLFGEFDILDEFPDRTATSLYLEVMLHKYYLSQQMRRDVGLIAAFEDYSRLHKHNDQLMKKLSNLIRSARKFLPTYAISIS